MVFLQGHEISPPMRENLKAYGDKAVSVVKENPYRLALDISGIGFQDCRQGRKEYGDRPQFPKSGRSGHHPCTQ